MSKKLITLANAQNIIEVRKTNAVDYDLILNNRVIAHIDGNNSARVQMLTNFLSDIKNEGYQEW